MSSKTLSAGDFIDARCTKCRLVTNHTIVAMVEDQVVRVQCNTCEGMHKYHAPKVAREPVERPARSKAATPRKPRQSSAAAEKERFEALLAAADPAKVKPYDMGSSFKAGDLLNHKVFGHGLVTAVVAANKIEVLFEDGKKVLRCNL